VLRPQAFSVATLSATLPKHTMRRPTLLSQVQHQFPCCGKPHVGAQQSRFPHSHRHQMLVSFKHGRSIEIFPVMGLEITLHHRATSKLARRAGKGETLESEAPSLPAPSPFVVGRREEAGLSSIERLRKRYAPRAHLSVTSSTANLALTFAAIGPW
jgi:hypothetical protein